MRIVDINIDMREVAAVVVWTIIFGIVLFWLPSASPDIRANTWLIVVLFILYMVCFFSIIHDGLIPHNHKYFYAVFLVQLLCAFGMMWLSPIGILHILAIIWVSYLPYITSLLRSFLIMVPVVTLWFVLYSIRWEENVFLTGLLWSAYHVFAIFMTYETVKAEKATEEAQRLNKELQATQHLLSEASRLNERTRIARELHDLLGHHLTALSINLQVASHLSEGQTKDKVEQCHSLAKLLLSDVREAVSTLRENQYLDFEKMLQLMIDKVPRLKVNCHLDTGFNLEQIELAKVLLSCIQEALTNSLKHSGASEFWIQLNTQGEDLLLALYDNGKLLNKLVPGNGLSGMKERITELGGQLETSELQDALKIDIKVPLVQNKVASGQVISG